jgi:beta-lactamase class A
MAIFKREIEKDQFIPREFPEKILKPLPKTKGEGKLVFAVFLGTIVLSLGFWFYGGFKRGEIFKRDKNFSDSQIILPVVSPTPTPEKDPSQQVILEISNLTRGLKGTYGIYVYNLTRKRGYGINEESVFPAASLMKLPVLLTLYQEKEAGKVNLDDKYILKDSDKQKGAGVMQYKPAGTVYTLRQMAELAANQSDNTAFFIFRKLLGDENIQKTIDRLGMSKTSLKEFETTPFDIGLFFRKFYAGSILDREDRDEILNFLTKTFDESRIPAGIPEGVRVAHKVGTDIGVISDAGIVFAQKPFILVIMSKDVLEKEAKEVLPKITRAVWEFEQD